MKDISFQLYSARNIPLADALRIVADNGYRTVEAYRDNVADMDQFQSLLKANDLTCASAHVGRDELKSNMPAVLEMVTQLDLKQVVCPFLMPEDRPQDTAGWKELAVELAGYADEFAKRGVPFAWHNHDFEFEKTADGDLPMRVLLDTATQMQWEIDLGWIQRAGESSDSWLRTYGDRISSVHLKDVAASGECTDEGGWADVGHGVMDWQSIAAELKSLETELYIVEHDNPSDVARFAERSIAAIRSWDL